MNKPKAVIVGGSIAGVSCAHTLMIAGWDVTVIEKSSAPPTKSPIGAGLGLDPVSQMAIESWLGQPGSLLKLSSPLATDQNNATDSETRISRMLVRDEKFNFRAVYWSDLYNHLYNALPPNTVLWGHQFISFADVITGEKSSVKVRVKYGRTDQIVEFLGDLLVAADGCLSSIRQTFLPGLKLRYSGYCAWRGVLDLSGNEDSETYIGIRKLYPDLGKCLYSDMGPNTHSIFYELHNKRMNWIWYVNQPEPETKGSSVTMKVSREMIMKMQKESIQVWAPELAKVMNETKEPFLNVIYDCDPIPQIFHQNVVLVGEAAHPTTPHGLRSTNMSILDAEILGKCLTKWQGVEKLSLALEEYQSVRGEVTSKQVLQSRRMGRVKQGLPVSGHEMLDLKTATEADCEEFQQKNFHRYNDFSLLDFKTVSEAGCDELQCT